MVITSSPKPTRMARSLMPEPVRTRDDALLDEPASLNTKVHLAEHPLARHTLSFLRDKSTPHGRFRTFSNQLLVLMTMEATRSLSVREQSIETEIDSCTGCALAKKVVFLSLTRHGLGLSHAIADFIPDLSIGSVSLETREGSQHREPRLHLVNAPALSESRVILFDPVIATGISVSLALALLRSSGAADLTLLSFIISSPGLKRVQSAAPDLTVWAAAIDEELSPKHGPVPGLGNFAERFYG